MLYFWRYSHHCHIPVVGLLGRFLEPPYPFWEGNFDLSFELQLVTERYLAPFLSTPRQTKCKRNLVISLKIAKVTRHALFSFVEGGGPWKHRALSEFEQMVFLTRRLLDMLSVSYKKAVEIWKVQCLAQKEMSTAPQRRKPAGSHLYPEVPAQDQELFAGMSDVQRNKYLANLHQKKKAASSTKSCTGTWVLSCVSFHIYSNRFWFLACNCCVL